MSKDLDGFPEPAPDMTPKSASVGSEPADLEGDVNYITAALSTYSGGPAGEDVSRAWAHIVIGLHDRADLLAALKRVRSNINDCFFHPGLGEYVDAAISKATGGAA